MKRAVATREALELQRKESERDLRWADSAIRAAVTKVIKAEDSAIITAENIRDEPQSAQLFEIAAGFRKFDPRTLIEQIKQSDVWVAGDKDSNSSHR